MQWSLPQTLYHISSLICQVARPARPGVTDEARMPRRARCMGSTGMGSAGD